MSGGAWVGGLVAENRGEIHSSYVTGRVSGDQWVGGLVGTAYERGRITASFSTARVTGSDRLVGGLVGVNSGPVSTSYATGRVSGGDGVGGLIGGHCGSLTAGYATGTVSGGSDVGGLIGLTDACSDDDTVVTASYWGHGHLRPVEQRRGDRPDDLGAAGADGRYRPVRKLE